jgi:hypothetical protein
LDVQGGDEEGGGGSDIGALLGNLGPLIGGLSGVSTYKYCLYFNDEILCYAIYIIKHFFQLTTLDEQGGDEEGGGGSDIGALLGALGQLSGSLSGVSFLRGDEVRILLFRSLKITFFSKYTIRVIHKGKDMSDFVRSL